MSEVLITVTEAIEIARRVAAGEFVSEDEGIDASSDALHLKSLGPDRISAAALERIKHGIEQLDCGEVVTSEQIDAFFAEWFRDLDRRIEQEKLAGKSD